MSSSVSKAAFYSFISLDFICQRSYKGKESAAETNAAESDSSVFNQFELESKYVFIYTAIVCTVSTTLSIREGVWWRQGVTAGHQSQI